MKTLFSKFKFKFGEPIAQREKANYCYAVPFLWSIPTLRYLPPPSFAMVNSKSEVLPLALSISSDDATNHHGKQGTAQDFEDDTEGDA